MASITNKQNLTGSVQGTQQVSGNVNVGKTYTVGGTNIIVDDHLSTVSTNPVQNKVITKEVDTMKSRMQDMEITTGNIDALLSTI